MTTPEQTKRPRRIVIDDDLAQWLADLGKQPGRLVGNLTRGVVIVAEYAKAHMPLDKKETP